MPVPVEGNDILLTAINAKIEPLVRQLDRMEERMESRTRDLVTRNDLEVLRKELVTRDAFEPQLNALKLQLTHVDTARIEDKKLLEKRMDDLENEQMGKQDRMWIRISQAVAMAAFAVSMFDLLTHLKFTP